MNDDRFNFDEELPDWLQDDDQDDDQPDKDQPQAADSASWDVPADSSSAGAAPNSLGVTGELPWRQDVSDPTAAPGSQSSLDDFDWDGLDSADDDAGDSFATDAASDSSLDWLTDDSFDADAVSESSPEPTGDAPDWLSGPTDFDSFDEPSDTGFDAPVESSPEPAGDVPDWLSGPTDFDSFGDDNPIEAMTESDYGASDSLDMDDFGSFFDDEASQDAPPQAEPVASDESSDWLADELGFDEEPVAESQSSVDEDVDLLDFLFDEDFPAGDDEPAADSEPSGVIRRLSDAAPPPEAEPPQLRRLSDAPPPQQPPPPEEPRRIRKLSEAGKPSAPEGELTFEEWERQQHQAQFEEEHAEELALESEVPDWFQDNVKMGDAADEIASLLIPEEDLPDVAPAVDEEETGGVSGDYVPEWFMGLEEQNLDEAPDWVRDAASGADALTDLTDLSAFAPPEPEEPEAPEVPAEDDWMSSFAASPTETEAAPEADLGLPDLTADMGQADAAPMMADEMTFDESDESDLDSLFGDDFGDDFVEEPDLVPSSADEPDWMADMGLPQTDSSPPPQVPSPSPAKIDSDSPAWLKDYETPDASTEEPDLFADQKIGSDMAWLDDVGSADFSDAFAADDSAEDPFDQLETTKKPSTDELIASVDISNLDDLLGATGPESSLVPAGTDTVQDDLFASTEGIDDLFDGVDESLFESFSDTPAQADAPVKSATPSDDAGEDIYEAEGPDWVHEMRPDLQVKLNVGGLNVEFDQQGVNQLPESLQNLRDQARSVVQSQPKDTDEALSTQGPLAGITGGLPISPIATAVPSELELTTQTTIPSHQAQQIDMLEEALAIAYEAEAELEPDFDELEDVAPAPKPAKPTKKRRVKRKLDRFIVSVILLAAIIGPFATDALHIAEEPDTTAVAVEQARVISAVTALEPGDYVLLAFEYGPTAAGELNPLAEAVLRDVLSQRAIPIVISTNPLGALNGRAVLEKLAADENLLNALERDENLVAGEDYYALRYLSGGAVAIRGLAQSETLTAFVFSTDNTGEKTDLDFGRLDASDFAMMFVIGESIDDVRNWAEQFDVPDLTKFTLVTAAAEPLARAYVDADGTSAFEGYLAGYRDTYRYNELRNQRTLADFEAPKDVDVPDPDISQWHSMAVGALVAGLLIIIGMVFNTLRNTRRRRRV